MDPEKFKEIHEFAEFIGRPIDSQTSQLLKQFESANRPIDFILEYLLMFAGLFAIAFIVTIKPLFDGPNYLLIKALSFLFVLIIMFYLVPGYIGSIELSLIKIRVYGYEKIFYKFSGLTLIGLILFYLI